MIDVIDVAYKQCRVKGPAAPAIAGGPQTLQEGAAIERTQIF